MSEIKAFCETCHKITFCNDFTMPGNYYCEECDYYVPTDGTEEVIEDE